MRDYTRLYAIERDLARFYASATLGVFFLIGIADLELVRLASFISKDLRARIYASVRDYARLYAIVRD